MGKVGEFILPLFYINNDLDDSMNLVYIPKTGKLAGLPHIPYKKDGLYVVS